MTLAGTNSYVVGRDPAYVIDPGPDDPDHIGSVRGEAERRGGLGGVLLTHSHADHTDGVAALGGELLWGEPGGSDEAGALAAAIDAGAAGLSGSAPDPEPGGDGPRSADSGPTTRTDNGRASPEDRPGRAPRVGPFAVIPTPGHAADHVAFLLDDVCFCGDLILGEGSSIVPPAAAGGSLGEYMASLGRLNELELMLLCPGHGPWITDPGEMIAAYLEHRADRESKLLAALDSGERSRARLLDLAWEDVPTELRPAAALAMQAHLEKLAAEGRAFAGLRE